MNGRSEAVRLPKNCRFSASEVYIKKFGDLVMLIPKDKAWDVFVQSLDGFSDDFMNERPEGALRGLGFSADRAVSVDVAVVDLHAIPWETHEALDVVRLPVVAEDDHVPRARVDEMVVELVDQDLVPTRVIPLADDIVPAEPADRAGEPVVPAVLG